MRRASFLLIPLFISCVCTFDSGQARKTERHEQIRKYYIAADEVDWDYAPQHVDQITGERFHFQDIPDSKGMLDPNATAYRKAFFREYTDATFRTLKPRPEPWAHLGILGPLIRAEVGDTIQVVFKNNASRPYSIHPHGVFYKKDSEGAPYEDGTRGGDKADDAVAPGLSYIYIRGKFRSARGPQRETEARRSGFTTHTWTKAMTSIPD